MSALQAVFFDMDGVIVDTEKDGHRVSFNAAFQEVGIPFDWGVDLYHDLLQIAGGKERMRRYFDDRGFSFPEYTSDKDGFIRKLHGRKTEIFMDLIASGKLPLRPGVRRLMDEITRNGIFLGICTTSSQESAETVIKRMLEGVRVDLLLAGDAVRRKKPDPEIYLRALERSRADPGRCFVIEDSHIGVVAARSAGVHVAATVNEYTKGEDVSLADLVVDSLGEPGGPYAALLGGRALAEYQGCVDLALLERLLSKG